MTMSDLDVLNELELDVEAQGGARLPEKHTPLTVTISYKDFDGKPQRVQTQACGHPATFVIPYEHQPRNADTVEERFITLCAYCDLMPFMSRFSGGPI